jgi:hypothetical protein
MRVFPPSPRIEGESNESRPPEKADDIRVRASDEGAVSGVGIRLVSDGDGQADTSMVARSATDRRYLIAQLSERRVGMRGCAPAARRYRRKGTFTVM